MPLVRRRSIPAADHREGEALSGALDGANNVFATATRFRHDVPGVTIKVFYNGARLELDEDYFVVESGGPGSGYDRVVLMFAPLPGDKLLADYVVG